MNAALNEAIGAGYQCPRGPVEVWRDRPGQHVLGFAVGIRENVFGVGGSSPAVARVADAIGVEFGVQLPPNVLTGHPAVEHLAGALRELLG